MDTPTRGNFPLGVHGALSRRTTWQLFRVLVIINKDHKGSVDLLVSLLIPVKTSQESYLVKNFVQLIQRSNFLIIVLVSFRIIYLVLSWKIFKALQSQCSIRVETCVY